MFSLRLKLGLLCLLVLLTTGCLKELIGAIAEAVAKGIACGLVGAFPTDGLSNPGDEDAFYVLKGNSDSLPLMLGTAGDVQFFDFSSYDSVDIEKPSVVDIYDPHIDEERCGIMAYLETNGVGTTDLTFIDEDGDSHTWQVSVAEASGLRLSSINFGELLDGETLELSDGGSVEIAVWVVDSAGEPLAFLEPAYWSVSGPDGIVEIEEHDPDEEDTEYSSTLVTGEIDVLALEPGETTLAVEIGHLEASFPLLVAAY